LWVLVISVIFALPSRPSPIELRSRTAFVPRAGVTHPQRGKLCDLYDICVLT